MPAAIGQASSYKTSDNGNAKGKIMKTHAKSVFKLVSDRFGFWNEIKGVEVGVWRGDLSKSLLSRLPRLKLWMVDPWEDIEPTATMPKAGHEVTLARKNAERIARIFGSRAIIYQMTSTEATADFKFDDMKFDFIFIDACHLYDDVREDIEAWFPLIREGGLIMGHDYDGRGDRKKKWGVKRAVDEFAAKNDLKVGVSPGLVWSIEK